MRAGRYTRPAPLDAALGGKCPRCGQGRLFAGFLRLAEACSVCGLDFAQADSGDGPAFFVMSAVGFVSVTVAFALRFALDLPAGAVVLIAAALILALTLLLLRPTKALLIALQFQRDAREGRGGGQG